MDKKLISLKDWNDSVFNRERKTRDVPNGIACPLCGSEMVDTDINLVLCSNPGQLRIRCMKCVYTGTRYI